MKKFSILKFAFVALFASAILCFGGLSQHTVKANREITGADISVPGASIRIDCEDGRDGIRFPVRIEKSLFDENKDNIKESGTLITTMYWYTEKNYTDADMNITKSTETDSKIIKVVTTSGWFTANESCNFAAAEEASYMQSQVYVYNIGSENYDMNFVVKGYIILDDDTVVYSNDTLIRSMSYVADKARADYSNPTIVEKLEVFLNEYPVTYKNGDTVISIENVKYGDKLKSIPETTKSGYTFTAWKIGGTAVDLSTYKVTSSTVIEAEYVQNASYSVKHYLRNVYGAYDLTDTETLSYGIGLNVVAQPKLFGGYKVNETLSQTVNSGAVLADNSLVLAVYYENDEFTFENQLIGGHENLTITKQNMTGVSLDDYRGNTYFYKKTVNNGATQNTFAYDPKNIGNYLVLNLYYTASSRCAAFVVWNSDGTNNVEGRVATFYDDKGNLLSSDSPDTILNRWISIAVYLDPQYFSTAKNTFKISYCGWSLNELYVGEYRYVSPEQFKANYSNEKENNALLAGATRYEGNQLVAFNGHTQYTYFNGRCYYTSDTSKAWYSRSMKINGVSSYAAGSYFAIKIRGDGYPLDSYNNEITISSASLVGIFDENLIRYSNAYSKPADTWFYVVFNCTEELTVGSGQGVIQACQLDCCQKVIIDSIIVFDNEGVYNEWATKSNTLERYSAEYLSTELATPVKATYTKDTLNDEPVWCYNYTENTGNNTRRLKFNGTYPQQSYLVVDLYWDRGHTSNPDHYCGGGADVDFTYYDLNNVPTTKANGKWMKAVVPLNTTATTHLLNLAWWAGNSGKIYIKGFTVMSEEIYNNTFAIYPSYFDANLTEKITEIKANQASAGENGDTFGLITDIHWGINQKHSADLMQKVLSDCSIPYYFNAGDIVSGAGIVSKEAIIQDIQDWKDSSSAILDKCLIVEGNHDAAYSTFAAPEYYKQNLSKQELYDNLFSFESQYGNRVFGEDGTYYYVDNLATQVRYIVLNGYDVPSDATDAQGKAIYNKMYLNMMSEKQLKWFANVALNVPNANYSVVLCSHANALALQVEGQTSNYDATIIKILNAFKNHSADSVAYSTGLWYQNYAFNVDYTGRGGNVVGWFSGHTHGDAIQVFDGITCVTTMNDSISSAAAGAAQGKEVGTYTEQCFDIMTIDKTLRKVYITRIGAGADREFNY